jgi:O-antigen biosynthesis protein
MVGISKNYTTRGINDLSSFYSKVDIIIPFHGQYQKVTRCLESILRCTNSNAYTITLVDDCSPNAEYAGHHLSNVQGIQLLRTEKRLGFGGACFEGFKNTTNSWIVFLNSDCIIEDLGWLRAMGESLLNMKDQGVRMVSPLTNNALGHSYQEMTKEEFCSSESRSERVDRILDIKRKNEDKETDPEYLSMYCFMCHRELFKRCGGFIREYPYGWYEDMEFAYRMNKFGFKQAVCRSAWVYHEGECTIKELWRKQPQTRAIMEVENFTKCQSDLRELFSKT